MTVVRNPTEDERQFWRGEICFDRKRTDILSDPLVVVDPEVQELGWFQYTDRETYDAVKYNDTNLDLASRAIRSDGLPDDTPCIEVSFLDGETNQPTIEGRTYTYPTFRLMRVTGGEESDLPSFRPPMLAAAELIHHLEQSVEDGGIDSAEELYVTLMEAGVDGEMLAAASELAE